MSAYAGNIVIILVDGTVMQARTYKGKRYLFANNMNYDYFEGYETMQALFMRHRTVKEIIINGFHYPIERM